MIQFDKQKPCVLFLIVILLLSASNANATAWKLSRNIWSEEDEKTYSDFVATIGDSKYSNLNKFIKDPKVNPLYGEEDKKFNLSPDCADLPYALRAYVAYKLRLPFSYTSAISGNGGDQRYSKGNKPTSFKDQDYFSSPQNLFSQVTLVNSGFFRMAADTEDADHYPVKVSKKSIIPGTVYYDPDGHVAVVAKVTEDGRVRVIDAHPDRTISKPWFGAKFSRGSKSNGGGFKRWRPIRYTSEGNTVRTRNHNIADYSGDDQFCKSFSYNERSGLGYHEYVRQVLTDDSRRSDPVREFAFMMQDLQEDISYRAVAVSLAIEKGISIKPHPGALPSNIYGTDGLWEEFSTPSRDARLKVAFREFYDRTRQMVLMAEQVDRSGARDLATQLVQKYDELNPQLCISYVNSADRRVVLTFAEVITRLFDLSFDPYHSVEYRWGGQGEELASSNDGDTKKRFYELERKLRNQLERVYNQATPLSMGPEKPVEIDTRGWLSAYLQGNSVDSRIVAINREVIAPALEFEESKTSTEPVNVRPDGDAAETETETENEDEINVDAKVKIAAQPVTQIVVQSSGQTVIQSETFPAAQPAMVVAETLPAAAMKNSAESPGAESSESLWKPLLNIGDSIAAAIDKPEDSFARQ